MTTIIKIDPSQPEADLVEQATDFLRKGEVIAYPTETIYGLGADVFNKTAVKKIYELKARDYGLPISILVSDIGMLKSVVSSVPREVLPLIQKFWPGPLTILFPASDSIPKGLITNTGKVGIRISSNKIATALVKALGKPITTTSANRSGFPPSLGMKHVQNYFGAKLCCIVDGGDCEPSKGSTVVDVSEDSMRIIRSGKIPEDEVIDAFRKYR